MKKNSKVLVAIVAMACSTTIAADTGSHEPIRAEASAPRVLRFVEGSTIELRDHKQTCTLARGQRCGAWTYMGTVQGRALAVLEDFTTQNGRILFVNTQGVQIELPKSAESNIQAAGTLFLGHSAQEIMHSGPDVLGNEVLSHSGDPQYTDIDRILPPLGALSTSDDAHPTLRALEAFVATPDTSDKIYFIDGGLSPNFYPEMFQHSIATSRAAGTFLQGLVGGYLPAVRYVYPDADGAWTEMVAFAPFRLVNSNAHFQPVWYRITRIENGTLKWSRYFDSYHPYLPETDPTGAAEQADPFFSDLIDFRERWNALLEAGMKISLPDKRVENMARFSLVGSMMTRAGDWPKYGIPSEGDRPGYGVSEHDGFPDTFTNETDALLDWGLIERSGRYIDSYLAKYVREDGSLLYRGPETGQYGRMLAIFAKYLSYGGDKRVLLQNRAKVEGIVRLLLALRAKALTLPTSDPAHGLLSGRSEADTFGYPPDFRRYTQPYFSNSAEAVRGFRDFGHAWQALGLRLHDEGMTSMGTRLVNEAADLKKDLDVSMSRSSLTDDGGEILPVIAGARLPPDAALERDRFDPQLIFYRPYMEMLHSGVLSESQIRRVRDYFEHHRGLILGMPWQCLKLKEEQCLSFGFLSSGYGYSLLQTDRIREALLLLYSEMAHEYTRGTWIAPEERDPLKPGWPYNFIRYSTAAQVTVAELVRWLLVFEDPQADTLWLGKGVPTQWLEEGKVVTVNDALTQWGRISFEISSHISLGRVDAKITFPPAGLRATTRLRLRTPAPFQLRSVTVNGKPWPRFDPKTQVIEFPPGVERRINLVARY